MKKSGKRPCYSYIRFSSLAQAKGDSVRRQIERTRVFCREEGLVLNEDLRDEAVSAYRGKHRKEGALGGFLKAVQSGMVPPGSVLVIESLDRLSREQVRFAQAELLQLINHGIEVVTLADRQRYSAKSVDENPGLLFGALAVAMRAHDESASKADRLAERWREKRRRIAAGEHVRQVLPAWLKWEGKQVVADPERAKVIERIFQWSAAGFGRRRIAAMLNEQGVEPWGRGRRKARGGWQESYIFKLLRGREVLGEFQAYQLTAGRNSKRVPVGDPVRNYYPAVVTPELWHAAQGETGQRTVAKGRPGGSILRGLIIDPDGAPMHTERKGDNCDYVATSRAFRRAGKPVHRWRLDHLEGCVMQLVGWLIDWKKVNRDDSRDAELRVLRGTLGELHAEDDQIKGKLARAAKALLDDLGDLGAELKEQARMLTARRAELRLAIAATEGEIQLIEGQPASAENLQKELKGDTADPEVRRRINFELRRLVRHIQVWPTGYGCSRISDEIVRRESEGVAEDLKGNRGLGAKASGRLVGAIEVVFPSGRKFASLWTYRPSARVMREPDCLGCEPEDVREFGAELQERKKMR